MSFAPRFSPDGKELIMSLAQNGATNIYIMDLETKNISQLTYGRSIDTSPSFSPDGKNIIFNSDRSGGQHLYVMNRNGKNIKRVSFGRGSYATPVWSPRGDYIAFTKFTRGRFFIGLMHPDGSSERLIAEGYLKSKTGSGTFVSEDLEFFSYKKLKSVDVLQQKFIADHKPAA